MTTDQAIARMIIEAVLGRGLDNLQAAWGAYRAAAGLPRTSDLAGAIDAQRERCAFMAGAAMMAGITRQALGSADAKLGQVVLEIEGFAAKVQKGQG